MRAYEVEMIRDGKVKYFFIRNMETMEIELLPTRFLTRSLIFFRAIGDTFYLVGESPFLRLFACLAA